MKIDNFIGGKIPDFLEFFYGSKNKSFYIKCKLLDLIDENKRFVGFLNSDYYSRIMRENELSIHIETCNIYYKDLNINESIYDFYLAQEDISKKLLYTKFNFDGDFQSYIKKYLGGIDAKDDAIKQIGCVLFLS